MLYKHLLGYGKFFSPDGDSGGGGGTGDQGTGTDGGDGNDAPPEGDGDGKGDDTGESVDTLKASITRLEGTLEKERELRKTADREARRIRQELAGRGNPEEAVATITTERDTARAEADDWRGKYRDAVARNALIEAATEAGAVSVKAVVGLLSGKVELDDDGNPANIAEIVKALQEDDPALFRHAGGTADGGITGKRPATNDINATIRRMAGRRGY